MTNPFIAQRELRAGRALIVFERRGVVAVTGADRVGYLDALVSQQVSQLPTGDSVESLLLDPHGHIEYALRIIDDGTTTWILTDEEQSSTLADFLDRMTFRKDVAARDASHEFVTVGCFSDELIDKLRAGLPDLVVWRDPWQRVAEGGWQYASADEHPAASWNYSEVLIPATLPSAATEIVTQAIPEITIVNDDAWDALRIAAWRPRFATEVDATSLPHELDWLRSAVHLNKGCYRGQEAVAKVHNLGHPPRRLVQLHLDGTTNELPLPGATVRLGDDVVGRVTSAAHHFEDGPIALAVIKRTVDSSAQLAIDASVGSSVGSLPATQVVIVPTDAGRTVEVPRLTRFGRVSRTPVDE